MKQKNIRYRWQYWTLWKSWEWEFPEGSEYAGGATKGVFTLNPRNIYLWYIQWWGWVIALQSWHRKLKGRKQ